MRVLIVGAAGFIGKAVADALAEAGIESRLADTRRRLERSDDWLPGRDVREFDFSRQAASEELLDGVDALVHLGCTTNPARSMADMAFDADSNIGPSIRLFESAARAGIARVIFASSGGTVYGVPECARVCEDAPTVPISAYGVSKLAVERYLAICPGVCGISLRVANPYGAGQLRGSAVGVIARYLLAVSRGQPLEVWGTGSVIRDYIAIADVAQAFLSAVVTRDIAPGPYNVGSGEGASINEIISRIFAVSHRRVHVEYQEARGYDVPAIVLDSTRFRSQSGWHPRTGLDQGISELWSRICAPATV
ncbi:MAG: NAD-dependent epimerase/dehydratase family protein [Lysobacter sp.]|nr:NAD-dependent epimerase/dehydratase family protein [Lysobacter sp.]MDQ3269074.1 NAD-dependent epimerase/dehydratase family protein [Pseudomonadota bacterium]